MRLFLILTLMLTACTIKVYCPYPAADGYHDEPGYETAAPDAYERELREKTCPLQP